MKTHVVTISRTFPMTHKRKGEQTFFIEQINETFIPVSELPILGKKIHTIRANYLLWAKRIREVQEGKAVLSLRYWSGRPYHTNQIEFMQLTAEDGVGIQRMKVNEFVDVFIDDNQFELKKFTEIAKNDGLSFDDFEEWFTGYDLSKKMAVIHFTKFRY